MDILMVRGEGDRLMVRRDGDRPTVVISGGGIETPLPPLWLRERSAEPSQLDAVTEQRLVDPHRFAVDLELTAARVDDGVLRVEFNDGHATAFDAAELVASIDPDDGLPRVRPWDVALTPHPGHDWPALRDGDAALVAALDDFIALGFVILHGVPTEPGAVLAVAEHFGYVRETNFGALFDVRSYANSNDLAYRSIALGPHTDNPYRTPVPGIQLLHCLVNDTTGGLSTLVDGIAVADRLRADDPEAFAMLASMPVRFRFRDAETELVAWRPIISLNHRGEVSELHYSPKLDELPVLSAAETRRYQAARQRLAVLLVDPELELRFRLEPGDLMMFANDRVLHGRTSYDPAEGDRHLQGCYIDHDAPRSRYRVLRRSGARS